MADKDFTAADNATPEQLAKQFPCNENPFGVWYDIDGDSLNRWVTNNENGDSISDVASYEIATVIADALRMRHKMINNDCLILDAEQQKGINYALLIGLESFGELERINDEVGKYDLVPSLEKIPESIRPIHPTGANDTISAFAAALRYMQPV